LSLALIFSAVAAHAQDVKVNWDRTTDFTRYKTYQWMTIPSPRTPTPEIEALIYGAVDAQLEAQRPQEGRERRTRSVRRLRDHAQPAQGTAGATGRRENLMADGEFLERALPLGQSYAQRHSERRYR
jgi:hypothetical protein